MTPIKAPRAEGRAEAVAKALLEGKSFTITSGPPLMEFGVFGLFYGADKGRHHQIDFHIDQEELGFRRDSLSVRISAIERIDLDEALTDWRFRGIPHYINGEPLRMGEPGQRQPTLEGVYGHKGRTGTLALASQAKLDLQLQRDLDRLNLILRGANHLQATIVGKHIRDREQFSLVIHNSGVELDGKRISLIATQWRSDMKGFQGYIVSLDSQLLVEPISVYGDILSSTAVVLAPRTPRD